MVYGIAKSQGTRRMFLGCEMRLRNTYGIIVFSFYHPVQATQEEYRPSPQERQ